MMESEIRIVIADDHPIVRQGLRQTIEPESNLAVVGEAGDGRAAFEMIERLRPDVAVLDVDMPHQDGFQVARSLAEAGNPAAVIFLTIHREDAMFRAALDLGAKGYVLKDSAIDDIVAAVREAAAGGTFTSLPMSSYLLDRADQTAANARRELGLDRLTPTENRILKLLSDYKTSKEIAELLGVSPRTVETHRSRICQKLNLSGAHALVKFTVENRSLL